VSAAETPYSRYNQNSRDLKPFKPLASGTTPYQQFKVIPQWASLSFIGCFIYDSQSRTKSANQQQED
jgi:hypothetical protein